MMREGGATIKRKDSHFFEKDRFLLLFLNPVFLKTEKNLKTEQSSKELFDSKQL
jgi:hypothetical protein